MPNYISKGGKWYPQNERVALKNNSDKIIKNPSTDEKLKDEEIKPGQDYIYSVTTSAMRDRRNNYLNPQDGSVVDLNLRFAYAKSRSNQTGEITNNRFIKTVVEWNRYQKFRYYRKWILATRLKGGNIIELGKRSFSQLRLR